MTYRYQRLPQGCIRLLRLHPGRVEDPMCCTIYEASLSPDLDMCPAYEALSYVWGDQSNPQTLSVFLQDNSDAGTLNLGSNLCSALLHLRHLDSSRIFWCDLICINQADFEEREQQVMLMASIYRTAARVIVWLGPEGDDSVLAVDAIRLTGSQIQTLEKRRTWQPLPHADPRFTWEAQKVPFSHREMDALRKLIARSWFKRLWVRQEVTLARSAVVMVGHQNVSWQDLVSTAAFLDEFIRLRGNKESIFSYDLFNLLEFGYMKSYEEIMEVFHACRACECTIEHDRVYAILGLLSSQRDLAIQPNYVEKAKIIFQDFVMQYYQHYRRLNILTLCEAAESPSWVPDFHKLRLNTGLHTRVAHYCWASGDAAGSLAILDDDAIEVYGVKCDTLGAKVAPPIDKDSEAGLLKSAIVKILKDHLGSDVTSWSEVRLEALTMGLLGCLWFERTGRKNHASLSFATEELKRWAQQDLVHRPSCLVDQPDSLVLLSQIVRVLFHGDSCLWTQDGYIGLGYQECQEGDLLYAVLGCRRLLALRKVIGQSTYRIVGKFDHPKYNDGQAFLGEFPTVWSVNYKHLLQASGRARFLHENGQSQWQDPRLCETRLPDGWTEFQDEDGIPYWSRTVAKEERWYDDPRLTVDELKKRGVAMEKLVIV